MIARYASWGLIVLYAAMLIGIAALWASGTVLRDTVPFVIGGTVFAGVGAVLVLRRPGNAVGWLCLAAPVSAVLQTATLAYATHALITAPGTLPGGAVAAWLAGWTATPFFFVLTLFLPLLFPTGRPPSPRWRPVLWASIADMAMTSLGVAFTPGPLSGAPQFENPFTLALLGEPFAPAAKGIVFAGEIVLTLASLGSVIARYRHAGSVERAQLKWFMWAFGFCVFVLFFGSLLEATVGVQVTRALLWYELLWPASVFAIPIAIGIAILRYRLYDIDIIIRRTIVYGATTIAVAGTFFGGVLLVQSLLRPFTGGNELAVAASTLASVALFQPFRQRIQGAVDRRFFRARYDAARTLDAFAERLRNEVDLEEVRAHLLGAVGQTMSPDHASVWLRETRR